MEFLEYEVKVEESGSTGYSVSLLRSPAGEATEPMAAPDADPAIGEALAALQEGLLLNAGSPASRVAERQLMQAFGTRLFDTLLPGELRSLYDVSRQMAAAAEKGLRIKLRIPSSALAALPWEFLYDSREGEYVCLSTSTPLVRYIELAQPQPPLAVHTPLRVLGMIASPRDLVPLDVDQERQRVDSALQPLQKRGVVDFHWLEGQTWRDLQGALQTGPWHVFQFVGHGGFDDSLGEGIVALCDDDGNAQPLGATEFARILGDHEPLRLAVLNACHGATSGQLDVFTSTAAVLVRRGTPAVIAMQYAITDTAAIELSRSFYAALANGLAVDESLTEARKAVSLAAPGSLEWATPVLFLRAPEGRLFEISEEASADSESRGIHIEGSGPVAIGGSVTMTGQFVAGRDLTIPGSDQPEREGG